MANCKLHIKDVSMTETGGAAGAGRFFGDASRPAAAQPSTSWPMHPQQSNAIYHQVIGDAQFGIKHDAVWFLEQMMRLQYLTGMTEDQCWDRLKVHRYSIDEALAWCNDQVDDIARGTGLILLEFNQDDDVDHAAIHRLVADTLRENSWDMAKLTKKVTVYIVCFTLRIGADDPKNVAMMKKFLQLRSWDPRAVIRETVAFVEDHHVSIGLPLDECLDAFRKAGFDASAAHDVIKSFATDAFGRRFEIKPDEAFGYLANADWAMDQATTNYKTELIQWMTRQIREYRLFNEDTAVVRVAKLSTAKKWCEQAKWKMGSLKLLLAEDISQHTGISVDSIMYAFDDCGGSFIGAFDAIRNADPSQFGPIHFIS
jgi:hypothetical protein